MKKRLVPVTIVCMAAVLVLIAAGQTVRERFRQRVESSRKQNDSSRSIKVGELTRNYLLHIPPSLDKVKQVPLLLVFHGGGGTPESMIGYARFDDLADKHGFLVAYPAGTDHHWNDGRPAAPKTDDVAFVRAVIAELSASYKVDPHRIYATGISNGGIFSQRLACDMAGTLAAVAAVAGTMPDDYAASCKPAAPISVLMIHGTEDPLVPFSGGTVRSGMLGVGGKVWSVPDTVKFWVGQNHCGDKPKTTQYADNDPNDGTRIREDDYSGCRSNTAVTLYTVNGGGHTWPGATQYLPEMLIGKTSGEMNASEVIWDFFSKHPEL